MNGQVAEDNASETQKDVNDDCVQSMKGRGRFDERDRAVMLSRQSSFTNPKTFLKDLMPDSSCICA